MSKLDPEYAHCYLQATIHLSPGHTKDNSLPIGFPALPFPTPVYFNTASKSHTPKT